MMARKPSATTTTSRVPRTTERLGFILLPYLPFLMRENIRREGETKRERGE